MSSSRRKARLAPGQGRTGSGGGVEVGSRHANPILLWVMARPAGCWVRRPSPGWRGLDPLMRAEAVGGSTNVVRGSRVVRKYHIRNARGKKSSIRVNPGELSERGKSASGNRGHRHFEREDCSIVMCLVHVQKGALSQRSWTTNAPPPSTSKKRIVYKPRTYENLCRQTKCIHSAHEGLTGSKQNHQNSNFCSEAHPMVCPGTCSFVLDFETR